MRRVPLPALTTCLLLAPDAVASPPLEPSEVFPPPKPSTAHRHEGFYLRAAGGPALVRSSWSSEKSYVGQPQNASLAGTGLEVSLFLGGSPIPGLAVGGVVDVSLFRSLEVRSGELRTAPSYLLTNHVGLFADGFLAVDSGWHAGGTVSIGGFQFCCPDYGGHDGFTSSTSSGYGGAIWTGYDAWVSDEWSVGGLLRVTGLWTSTGDAHPSQASTFTVSGLLTTLFH